MYLYSLRLGRNISVFSVPSILLCLASHDFPPLNLANLVSHLYTLLTCETSVPMAVIELSLVLNVKVWFV